MHAALDKGFVAADAAVIATMRVRRTPCRCCPGAMQPPAHARPAHAPARALDLYAIVDSAAALAPVLDAGVRTVQLRIKTPAHADAAWQRHAAKARCAAPSSDSAAAGAELFVNDHWALAHELGRPGVHLGQEDLLALGDEGRAALQATGMALGISSHSLWELARARTLAPRYIACGPVWPTTHQGHALAAAGPGQPARGGAATAGTPVIAIGGILEPRHVQEAARTGCDGVCIVRGLGDDPRATLPRFESALAAGRADRIRQVPDWPHPSLAARRPDRMPRRRWWIISVRDGSVRCCWRCC